jgi:mannitol-1-/sugar-/sorbitol-6-/2-deoxyglucose-6-phosphatase
MTDAVIFDMDGLLVDSEPWWRVAETNVFGRLSVVPSEADFERMMGNRIQEVIRQWHDIHPWADADFDATQNEIVDEVARLVIANAGLLPGVEQTIAFFKNKKVPVALASSSPLRLIEKLMSHYGLLGQFDLVRSAEFEPYGKPHPAVFLTTASLLQVNPLRCLVFEDSFNGLLAAKAARMKCVAVPEMRVYNQPRFAIADLKLHSLLEFDAGCWEKLNQ